jgi:hypothetical protein
MCIGFQKLKRKTGKQVGAELCQAQDKLGLVQPDFHSKEFVFFAFKSNHKEIAFVFPFKQFMTSSICQNIEVAFYLPKY